MEEIGEGKAMRDRGNSGRFGKYCITIARDASSVMYRKKRGKTNRSDRTMLTGWVDWKNDGIGTDGDQKKKGRKMPGSSGDGIGLACTCKRLCFVLTAESPRDKLKVVPQGWELMKEK